MKCNLRIFGLEETESDTKSLTKVIEESVLNVANDEDNLSSDSISTAKRIGEKQDDKVRMVLITFKYFGDKLKLFNYREELREKGIRISCDLT